MTLVLRSAPLISIDIDNALKEKQLTLSDCVTQFDSFYSSAIRNGEIMPLNKDFIQRVRKGKYKVVTNRIIQLCKFLHINPYETPSSKIAISELRNIEKLICEHPELEKRIAQFLHEAYSLVKYGINIKSSTN
ncbi:hypothetical protein SC936_00270 [Aggregatibacter actinomycetemcomitans serotype e str. SC936]|uniref:hypothetical protein n=1 Tax=Aggregatibacter actinomycetemcomitans TaxID=714 RepID=UPI00077EB564|nr:hypothetical protein [Aggregatibacter actinomycetemcomitans]KYK82850.1 hypothetical protein SC936_00270 [Aggregatibacter actinomycetemcomitans serotype e str. SC936]QEH46020.1 hypothetical protein FXN58_11150 [Aggregatibacter actinomycetemcomitans]